MPLSPYHQAILDAVSEHPRSGLQILAVLTPPHGWRGWGWKSVGSLYPALRKLERLGLVESWWGEEQPEDRGYARRRYYRTVQD